LYLLHNGVETKVQHPILMCEQLPYRSNKKDTTSNTQKIADTILSLPASEKVEKEDVKYIASLIKKYFNEKEKKS